MAPLLLCPLILTTGPGLGIGGHPLLPLPGELRTETGPKAFRMGAAVGHLFQVVALSISLCLLAALPTLGFLGHQLVWGFCAETAHVRPLS